MPFIIVCLRVWMQIRPHGFTFWGFSRILQINELTFILILETSMCRKKIFFPCSETVPLQTSFESK